MLDPISRKGYFNTIQEVYFDLFNEIGLGVKQNGYIYDQDNGNLLTFDNLWIKISFGPQEIYAGRNEIVFDPANNYKLIDRLFGYFLDKCKEDEEGDILQGFVAYYCEDSNSRRQRVCVKTLGRGIIESSWYWNIYLAFIECIFKITGYEVDLHNFDVEPKFDKNGHRVRE